MSPVSEEAALLGSFVTSKVHWGCSVEYLRILVASLGLVGRCFRPLRHWVGEFRLFASGGGRFRLFRQKWVCGEIVVSPVAGRFSPIFATGGADFLPLSQGISDLGSFEEVF